MTRTEHTLFRVYRDLISRQRHAKLRRTMAFPWVLIEHISRLRKTEKKKNNKNTSDGPARALIHDHQLRPFCFAVSFDTIMELSKSNERWGGGLPPAAAAAAHTHCYARLDSANARKYRSIHADRDALVQIDIIYFRICALKLFYGGGPRDEVVAPARGDLL